MDASRDLSRLLEIMARLRTPEIGCPWDLEQSFGTIAPYTIEEAYEVADAVAREDFDALKDELGDLLLQVVFHARIAEERKLFAFGDVVLAITEKLIRRHPHVFGGIGKLELDAVKLLWEDIKSREHKHKSGGAESVLDGVPVALPALTRADKIQKRAARVGFDWTEFKSVLDKIVEEIDEIRAAREPDELAEEIGDLLFATVNLARHANLDPETALRNATAKFERRFRGVERQCVEAGLGIGETTLEDLETMWQREKAAE